MPARTKKDSKNSGELAVSMTMTGREIHDVFGPVLPHAGADDTLPPITMLTVDVSAGMLHVLATDRYTIGIVRHPLPEGCSATFALTLPAPALKALLRQITTRAKLSLTLTVHGLSIEHTGQGVNYFLPAGTEAPFLPDWRAWMTTQTRKKPDPKVIEPRGVGLMPAYLARFRNAPRNHEPLEMRLAGCGVVVTCGTHFLGLVAAVNMTTARADTPDPLDDWLPTPASTRAA